MGYKETIEYRGKKIEIIQDQDPTSPSDYGDTDLFLVANHRQCYIPEPGEKRITNDPDELVSRWEATHWIFPLEAYIHSGVRLALAGTGNFPDRQWDVSQVGFVFASKKEWRLSKSARKAAECKVNEWNQYLCGDVWGYEVGEESCWGFYGMEYAIEEAKSIADRQIQQDAKEQAEADLMACADIATV